MKYTLLFIFITLTNNAFACSCGGWSENRVEAVKNAYHGSDNIVIAKVISINKLSPIELHEYKKRGFKRETTYFKKITSFKGDMPDKFTTTMDVGGGMCGESFIQGETYLLYLRSSMYENNSYATSICDLNDTLDGAEDDVNIIENLGVNLNNSINIYWLELANRYKEGNGVKKDTDKYNQLYNLK